MNDPHRETFDRGHQREDVELPAPNEPNSDPRFRANEPNLESPTPDSARTNPIRPIRGWGILILALLPALGAVWGTPWFVTQDGPAHVYNAEILARSFDPDSPFRDFYEVRWRPLPNWTGHLLLAGLVRIASARLADLIVTSLTMIGFAGSIFWLRRRVRGDANPAGGALLAALLSLNVTWLFGFTSFLAGACLFPIILGAWWSRRNEPDFGGVLLLMGLVVLSYFSHLVGLGLTAIGMAVLATTTPRPAATAGDSPGAPGRVRPHRGRLRATALALSPLLVLTPIYLGLSRGQGGTPPFPVWEHLARPRLVSSWLTQLGWVDPLSLMSKTALPFTERTSRGFAVLSPALWGVLAIVLWLSGDVARRRSGRREEAELRGWWVLAALLVLGGYFGPDSFGPDHGEYLPQRLVLLGLAALVPVFDPDLSTRSGRASVAALAVALSLQSLIVWDYALHSGRTAGTFASARDLVGRGRRVGTLLTGIRSRFRVNPLLHADNWLGVGTGNIVWSNYETRYYYFPVRFKAGLNRPDPRELEDLAIEDDPARQEARARAWARLLDEHAEAIDVLVCWKEAPRLDAITARRFEPAGSLGDLRIFRKKQAPPAVR